MTLLDVVTAIMGIVTLWCGIDIARSARTMLPGAGRGRRALRLFKAGLALYTGVWWLMLGLGFDPTTDVSRLFLRPAYFLFICAASLGIHYETLATSVDRFFHPQRG